MVAGQLAELQRELQQETEKSAAHVHAAETANEEGRVALIQELEALKGELSSRQKAEEERAQQMDDFKRRAATRVQAAERELATVKAELKQAQEVTALQRIYLRNDIHCLFLRRSKRSKARCLGSWRSCV